MNRLKRDNNYRPVLYKVMSVKTTREKEIAGKYARVLESLRDEGMDPLDVFAALQKKGIEKRSEATRLESKKAKRAREDRDDFTDKNENEDEDEDNTDADEDNGDERGKEATEHKAAKRRSTGKLQPKNVRDALESFDAERDLIIRLNPTQMAALTAEGGHKITVRATRVTDAWTEIVCKQVA